MPVFHLTTNEEIPVNIVHYEVSSLRQRADQIFITNSPVYAVHYEISPPGDKIEVGFKPLD